MKKGHKAPPLPKEDRTTAAVADALRVAAAPGWMWSHFPAGEARDEQTGAKLKRMGLKRGWSDFVLIAPDGRHHWMELKRGKASLRVEQEAFAQQLLQRGVPWKVARSFDEAIAVLTAWGAIKLVIGV